MLRAMLIALSVAIFCATVSAAAVVDDPLVTSITVVKSDGITGEQTACCGQGGSTSSGSSSRLNRSATPKPLSASFLDIDGGCSNWLCECYSAEFYRMHVDLTSLTQTHGGGMLQLNCSVGSSQILNATVVHIKGSRGAGGFYPYPFTANCSSSESYSCTVQAKPLRAWPVSVTANTILKIRIPSAAEAHTTGFILGMGPASFQSECYSCPYAGTCDGSMRCSMQLI
jgi:hypothetical protein